MTLWGAYCREIAQRPPGCSFLHQMNLLKSVSRLAHSATACRAAACYERTLMPGPLRLPAPPRFRTMGPFASELLPLLKHGRAPNVCAATAIRSRNPVGSPPARLPTHPGLDLCCAMQLTCPAAIRHCWWAFPERSHWCLAQAQECLPPAALAGLLCAVRAVLRSMRPLIQALITRPMPTRRPSSPAAGFHLLPSELCLEAGGWVGVRA